MRGEHGQRDGRIPEPFNVLRCLVAVVMGGVGMGLGGWLGLYGGSALDKALGAPLGETSGFMSIGYLTLLSVALLPLLGVVLGALWGHALLGGRGSFWVGLGAMVLALVPWVALFLEVRGLMFPALVLLPVAAAVGLELSNDPPEGPRVGPRRSTPGNPR